MIFQDPFSSLNPRMTVLDIVGERLRIHRLAGGKALEERVALRLQRVGLRPEHMRRYPHAFSGGQRLRLGIARAIVVDSRFVVADEAVSALDVSVRAQILKLRLSLKHEIPDPANPPGGCYFHPGAPTSRIVAGRKRRC